jgi:hypothetical protein
MHPFCYLSRVRDGERKNSLFPSKQKEKGAIWQIDVFKRHKGEM